MGNVRALPGATIPPAQGTPNDALVWALKQLLELAERGQLQTLWATGITADGFRTSTHVNGQGFDAYQGLGAIEALKIEYVKRNELGGT